MNARTFARKMEEQVLHLSAQGTETDTGAFYKTFNCNIKQYYKQESNPRENIRSLKQVKSYFMYGKKTTTSDVYWNNLLIHLLSIEIETCLLDIRMPAIAPTVNNSKISQVTRKWTGKIVWLVELIYSLESVSVINDGAIEIKEIVEIFEDIFDVKLKRIYDTYRSLRSLKKDRTPFLNLMRETLLQKMDNTDK